MPKRRAQKFTVILSEDEHRKAVELARLLDCSIGAAIRQGLQVQHTMLVLGQPVCANNQPCYVPHMHPSVQYGRVAQPAPPPKPPTIQEP